MSLLPACARHAASVLPLLLLLAGCGGAPEGPVLAGDRPGGLLPGCRADAFRQPDPARRDRAAERRDRHGGDAVRAGGRHRPQERAGVDRARRRAAGRRARARCEPGVRAGAGGGAGPGGGALWLCPGHACDPSARGGGGAFAPSGRPAAKRRRGRQCARRRLRSHGPARQGGRNLPAGAGAGAGLGAAAQQSGPLPRVAGALSRSARAAAAAGGRVRFHPPDPPEPGPCLRAPGRPRGGGAIGSHRPRR